MTKTDRLLQEAQERAAWIRANEGDEMSQQDADLVDRLCAALRESEQAKIADQERANENWIAFERVRNRAEQAEAALRALEWNCICPRPFSRDEGEPACASCGELQRYGHAADCKLKAALAAHSPEAGRE